jgi:hypothetical protein
MARAIIDPVKAFYRDHTIIVAIITVSFLVVAIFAVKNGLGVANKKAWNWLDVLVFPVVLAVGAAWYQETEQERDRQRENEQQDRERRETKARKNLQDEIEERRAQDAALQAYLDHMSALLIDKGLREDPDEYASVRVAARARTLAVLSQLDAERKGTVLQFLREARLINRECTPRKSRLYKRRVSYSRIIGLDGADLSEVHLPRARLISTSGEEHVSLKEAILREANLIEADLRGADLRGADLTAAKLRDASLRDADLGVSEKTKKAADLRGADLTGADLAGANLRGARYDSETSWPENFDPSASGAVLVPNEANTELLGNLQGHE